MFERLASAVAELEVLFCGDALAEGYRILDRLAAKLWQAFEYGPPDSVIARLLPTARR